MTKIFYPLFERGENVLLNQQPRHKRRLIKHNHD